MLLAADQLSTQPRILLNSMTYWSDFSTSTQRQELLQTRHSNIRSLEALSLLALDLDTLYVRLTLGTCVFIYVCLCIAMFRFIYQIKKYNFYALVLGSNLLLYIDSHL